MTRTTSHTAHKWAFATRFRRGAFGWKSALPIQRLEEALAEIREIARADPVLAADGAVALLEKLSPALERVDSSSRAIGTAVNRVIDSLVPVIAALSYELLARRPDLQAMRWCVEASLDRIDAAKAAFYPSFDIKAFLGFNALHLADLFTHASEQINLIPGLYLQIFDGGKLNANLSGAREGSNLLIEQYNQAVLNAVRDIAQTGSRLQVLDAEAELQKQRIESVAFARDSVEASFQRGLANRLSALDARQPVITEQVALLVLNAQMLDAEIALTKALGGGYRADPPVELKPR
jgi:multidrug efflux system outer membrane protein